MYYALLTITLEYSCG